MFLLATDTSGKDGSIALARCEADGRCEVLEVVTLVGGTFSAQLIPQAADLLLKHGLTPHTIDGFAVAAGPGSFTGLRIGLAAIKGLAEILNKPIAAVSLLEVLALAAVEDGMVLAAMDAGRQEVYTGIYRVHDKAARLVSEQLLTRSELMELELLQSVDVSIVTPEKTLAAEIRAGGLRVQEVERPRADAIARLGWRKILFGQVISPEALDANYIRRAVG